MSQHRYQVQGKIGQGGLGEVYLARDTQLDRDVALKRVRPPSSGDAKALEADLLREARTLSALQHPNIVSIFDVGTDEKGPFVIMELLKGEDLDQVMEKGALTVEDFRQVVLQSLEGMIAAQSLGLVHRDLKPGNLMVIWHASGKFQVKILDFGLAKFSRSAVPQTQDQEDGIFGSIFFMAPEQFERLPLDARTDMYSLGCIYYTMLTQKHPFDGQTGPEVMASHLQHHVRPLREARPDLPAWMADWVMWLISREMDDRPQDARIALEYFNAQRSAVAAPPPPPPPGPAQKGTTVRVVGRAAVPAGRAAAHTQPVPAGRQGTTTAALSSSGNAKKTGTPKNKKKSGGGAGTGKVIGILCGIGAVAAAVIYFTRTPDPADVARERLLAMAAERTPAATPADVPVLVKFASRSGEDGTKAVTVLRNMTGADLTEPLLRELDKAQGLARTAIIDALAARPSRPVVERMLRLAATPGESVEAREAAVKALTRAATGPDLAALIDLSGKIREDKLRAQLTDTAKQLIAAPGPAADRLPALLKILPTAPDDLRPAVLRVLSRSGSPEATAGLCAELSHPGARRRDGLAVLPSWTGVDISVANALFAAAGNSAADKDKLLAEYCRVSAELTSASGEDRVTMLRRAQPLMESTAAKDALCAALGTIGDQKAADYARELSNWAPGSSSDAQKSVERLLSRISPVGTGTVELSGATATILGPAEGAPDWSDTRGYLSGWNSPGHRLAWDLQFTSTAAVNLNVTLGTPRSSTELKLRVRLGTETRETGITPTSGGDRFSPTAAGRFTVPKPGTWRLILEPAVMEDGQPFVTLKGLTLTVQ